ncbi:MAG TPA: outer membrane lipoprotein chaperone LolA [Blastocatellia bacterium]|nr:outer membrane lipoprotein chaperone LolA [Blastocatellia bacterium]
MRFLFASVISACLAVTVPITPASSLLSANVQAASEGVELTAIISGIQKRYSRMKGLAADFVQMYHQSDGRTARETGRLLLKRYGKAKWEYVEPERKLFISDGKNIYFYVEGERHASRTSLKQSSDPQIPFLFLLGRSDLRSEFTRIELLSDERAVIAGNRVLRLVPARAPEEFKKLLVEVDPTRFEVRRLVIFERSGARMDFLLNNVRENYVAPDGEFTFTPPPGVIVKDQ